mmetsp:Transcript_94260/g.236597  ORF Transcript_94260/g.236597 Transcript_94260/m.236597 type:complete len:80 (-) Transcript_94260:26-265(-)
MAPATDRWPTDVPVVAGAARAEGRGPRSDSTGAIMGEKAGGMNAGVKAGCAGGTLAQTPMAAALLVRPAAPLAHRHVRG